MTASARIALIFAVLIAASIGWLILGGVTLHRSTEQSDVLDERVGDLWGNPQLQAPPELLLEWTTTARVRDTRVENGKEVGVERVETRAHTKAASIDRTRVNVTLRSDLRRKGLRWYSLYDVDFQGTWRYRHLETFPARLAVVFRFPDPGGMYDDFSFVIGSTDFAAAATAHNGEVRAEVPVTPGQEVQVSVAYRSRGRDSWAYVPAQGTAVLEDFALSMHTDFPDIDFPARSLSPSERSRDGAGYALVWRFEHVVTGQSIGMLTPQRLQPGELAGQLAFSAPISLAFFFAVLFLISTLKRIDIHPMNYLLLAGAFFAFHLLFAYTADRLPIELAFGLASAVSIALVVSYLRLVVGPRFAFVEAALAQLVYLVGFSLAHFWEGLTGLTVTVLAIVTLAGVMQLTARLNWSEVLARRAGAPAQSSPGRSGIGE